MKTLTRMMRWSALAGIAVASTALAQKEQWLDYHVNREGQGYRYLNLRTNPPPGVKLPKLNAQPYFARWESPLDPAGRWLCLDRTKRSGLYDRAYIDSNGNGHLDDETGVVTSRMDEYNANFEPAKVVFKGEDGPVALVMELVEGMTLAELIRKVESGRGQGSEEDAARRSAGGIRRAQQSPKVTGIDDSVQNHDPFRNAGVGNVLQQFFKCRIDVGLNDCHRPLMALPLGQAVQFAGGAKTNPQPSGAALQRLMLADVRDWNDH